MGVLQFKKSPVDINCYESRGTIQLPIYSEKEKLDARKISHCFYILNFQKKTKDLQNKITFELTKLFLPNNIENEQIDKLVKNSIISKFTNLFTDCKSVLIKYNLESEANNIRIDFKNLNLANAEIKEYYISLIEKHHMDFFDKLIRLINQRDEHLSNSYENNLIESTEVKSTIEGSFLNSIKMFKIKNSIISLQSKWLSQTDRDKISKEFDNLFNYYDNQKQYSILLDYVLEDGSFPPEIKKFVNKFFFLSLMNKSNYIDNTQKYIRVSKKDMKKMILEKNIEFFDQEEIIDENYNDLFQMMDDFEKSNEDITYKKTEIENNKDLEILEDNNKISSLKENLKKNKKFPKVIKRANNILFTIKEKYNDENNSGIPPIYTKTDKDIIFEEVLVNDKENLKNKTNSINDEIINTKSLEAKYKNSNNICSEYYKGEYDKLNLLYCGTGNLVKQKGDFYSKYFYHGTFRMGQKNGLGVFYKFNAKNQFEYYMGEWGNNKKDGYGSLIIIDDNNKTKIFRKGKFDKNCFIYGTQLKIDERSENIEIEKYEGEFFDNLFSGWGSLSRKGHKVNHIDPFKIDLDCEYEYKGSFSNNLENGKGTAKKEFKQNNYYYIYEGDFVNGQMHGEGKIEYKGNYYVDAYEGIFLNDQTFSIYGKVKFKSGDEYEGFFNADHQKTKVGIYQHFGKNKSKENFFGQFLNDKKDGLGRFVSNLDLKVLVGTYSDGGKNGHFFLTSNANEESKLKHKKQNNINYNSDKSIYAPFIKIASQNNILSTRINSSQSTNINSPKNKPEQIEFIKQSKYYFVFENDEVIEKSNRPIY